jgi:hypothetical protein
MTEETKKHEDESQTETKPASQPTPERIPDDAFGFIPGDFIPGRGL